MKTPFFNPFPHLHLLVSGGNTQLIYMNSFVDWSIIGQTLDDAAGECFDKIGRMIGLPYPAGVYLSQIASNLDVNILNFPVGMLKDNNYDFSYSGLKTHVRYLLQKKDLPGFKFEQKLNLHEIESLKSIDVNEISFKNDEEIDKLVFLKKICISTQHVIIQQLENKVKKAIKQLQPVSLGISGGVSASNLLRTRLDKLATSLTVNKLLMPDKKLTGDNAVMIGLAGIANQFYRD